MTPKFLRPLLLIGVFIFLSGITLTAYRLIHPTPLVNAWAPSSQASTSFSASRPTTIFAFLPYWLISEVKDRDLPPFTHLAYFGLEFDSQGQLITRTSDGYTEPGYSHFYKDPFATITRKAKSQGSRIILVLRIMDNSSIEGAISTPTSRQRIIAAATTAIKEKNLDGINVDFEYVGTPSLTTQKNFTLFSQELKQNCPSCELSVDVYANAAKQTGLWHLPDIHAYYDHIVIMGYDFHTRSSEVAGPVAPLRGSCPSSNILDTLTQLISPTPTTCQYNYDITTSVRDHLAIVPSHKIILAVPFYGYTWPTQTTLPGSLATDRGFTAPYKDILGLTTSLDLTNSQHTLQALDPTSLSSYLIYTQNKQPYQVWFDSPESLQLKRQLVDLAALGGVGVWAWGYDDESGQLWQSLIN